MTKHGFATRAVNAHLPKHQGVPSTPLAIPIYHTASFSFERAEEIGPAINSPDDSYSYSRLSNPTVAALENLLADLEGTGAGLAFASGMAAIHCALIHLLSQGDHVVAPAALYGGSFQVLRHILPRFGVETTFVDHHDLSAWRRALRPNTKIVYAETIGNPTLFVPDLAAIAEIAHGGGAKLLVDSTFATPYLCRPLELGADLVMHSASKFLGGHGDLVAGMLAGPKPTIDALRRTAIETGGIMAPFVAWLILRGLSTLSIRMDRHSSSALQIARWLEAHPRVRRVDYPGLPSHPNHAVARRQLGERFGGVLAFELPDRQTGARFVDRLRLIKRAASLGDVHSLIIQPSTTTHRQLSAPELREAHISEGFIRLAVGLEDPDDLDRGPRPGAGRGAAWMNRSALVRVALLSALLACRQSEDVFFTSPPPVGGSGSVVFAIESADALQLEARRIEGGRVPPVAIDLDRLGRSRIWALFYAGALGEHGLTEGPVPVLGEGRALDPPDSIASADFLGGEIGEWVDREELSDRLLEVRVERDPPADPCTPLGDERTFPLESRADGAFALRIDGERALIGTRDARLYLVTIEGTTPLGRAVPIALESGYLAPSGELFVAGAGGRTFRGRFEPELALTEIARGATRGSFRWLDGPKSGGVDELFAVTSSGALERFDGDRWHTLAPALGGDDWKRGLAWIAPNEAVAVGLSAPVVRAVGGQVHAEPTDAIDPLTAVAHAPGLGTFAGTLGGALLRDEGDRWIEIPDSPIDLPASALAPFHAGILISGGTGQTTEWQPGHGFCGVLSVNSPIVKHIAVLDKAVVLLGDARDNATGPTSVSVLVW